MLFLGASYGPSVSTAAASDMSVTFAPRLCQGISSTEGLSQVVLAENREMYSTVEIRKRLKTFSSRGNGKLIQKDSGLSLLRYGAWSNRSESRFLNLKWEQHELSFLTQVGHMVLASIRGVINGSYCNYNCTPTGKGGRGGEGRKSNFVAMLL